MSRSSAKQPLNATALKRCTVSDKRWKRKDRSRASCEIISSLWPNSAKTYYYCYFVGDVTHGVSVLVEGTLARKNIYVGPIPPKIINQKYFQNTSTQNYCGLWVNNLSFLATTVILWAEIVGGSSIGESEFRKLQYSLTKVQNNTVERREKLLTFGF